MIASARVDVYAITVLPGPDRAVARPYEDRLSKLKRLLGSMP